MQLLEILSSAQLQTLLPIPNYFTSTFLSEFIVQREKNKLLFYIKKRNNQNFNFAINTFYNLKKLKCFAKTL